MLFPSSRGNKAAASVSLQLGALKNNSAAVEIQLNHARGWLLSLLTATSGYVRGQRH